MNKTFRLFAFCLIAAACSLAFPLPPAHASGGYTAIGIGTTQAAACTNASNAIAGHCVLHGAISTTALGCIPLYNGSMEFVGYLCRCEASTNLCYNPPMLPLP